MTVIEMQAGPWRGTNGFRLMPTDPLAEGPASATLDHVAGGHLTSLAYAWEHPDDGRQDGLLVMWRTDERVALEAIWADSWHQQPTPMALTGVVDGRSVALDGQYAGDWGWRIELDAGGPAGLRMQMLNVVPASAATEETSAGPYPVMVMKLGPA